MSDADFQPDSDCHHDVSRLLLQEMIFSQNSGWLDAQNECRNYSNPIIRDFAKTGHPLCNVSK